MLQHGVQFKPVKTENATWQALRIYQDPGKYLAWNVLTHMCLCCSKAPPPGDALLMQLFASLPSLPRMPLLQYTACMDCGRLLRMARSSS